MEIYRELFAGFGGLDVSQLEDYDIIEKKRVLYEGPTDESNWVLPGKLLAGAFPGCIDDQENRKLLYSLLSQGITTFVCLQQEFEPTGVSEEMWRTGQGLRPYFIDVVDIADKVEAIRKKKPWIAPSVASSGRLSFIHFPIVDCETAEDHGVTRLAISLAQRLQRGEVIYLHCWGGHGRTGTVVSLMLAFMYGLNAEEAMCRCQFVHDLRKVPISVGSPQTQGQRDQVTRIVTQMQGLRLSSSSIDTSTSFSSTISSSTSGSSIDESETIDDSASEEEDSDVPRSNRRRRRDVKRRCITCITEKEVMGDPPATYGLPTSSRQEEGKDNRRYSQLSRYMSQSEHERENNERVFEEERLNNAPDPA